MDLKTLIRLKESVDSVAAQITKESIGMGFTESYDRLRRAVRDALDKELLEEFDSLMVELNSNDLDQTYQSMAFLAMLKGYLEGLIKAETWEAQMKANAEAYAMAKVKEERGVGFKSAD